MPLRLSGQEARSVAIMGIGGFVTFALYQLGILYIKQASDEYKLDPETECLQKHHILYSFMYQLDTFRHYNETAYKQAVLAADDIALRYDSISSSTIQPNMNDVAEVFSYMQTVKKQISKMSKSALKQHQPRDSAKILMLGGKIYPEIQSLYTYVLKSCRN